MEKKQTEEEQRQKRAQEIQKELEERFKRFLMPYNTEQTSQPSLDLEKKLSEKNKPEENKPEENKPEENKPEENKPEENKSEENQLKKNQSDNSENSEEFQIIGKPQNNENLGEEKEEEEQKQQPQQQENQIKEQKQEEQEKDQYINKNYELQNQNITDQKIHGHQQKFQESTDLNSYGSVQQLSQMYKKDSVQSEEEPKNPKNEEIYVQQTYNVNNEREQQQNIAGHIQPYKEREEVQQQKQFQQKPSQIFEQIIQQYRKIQNMELIGEGQNSQYKLIIQAQQILQI